MSAKLQSSGNGSGKEAQAASEIAGCIFMALAEKGRHEETGVSPAELQSCRLLSEELHTAGAVEQARMLAMAVITLESFQKQSGSPLDPRGVTEAIGDCVAVRGDLTERCPSVDISHIVALEAALGQVAGKVQQRDTQRALVSRSQQLVAKCLPFLQQKGRVDEAEAVGTLVRKLNKAAQGQGLEELPRALKGALSLADHLVEERGLLSAGEWVHQASRCFNAV